ncbi:rtcB-like protein [Haloferax mucosum ATCC BAA-1512]|uniref:tRNA-splicing ligase RtcB n=1 Tax=Haloferax mucosum ATCC BAA-1512 TaxID=662479 RepID=M0I7Q1_9EURY|nr:RtcB family protein [Haloferax mucosum]ELZ91997.1 rtcB-like protein [Haloferax mucosum ATCC BAA-1512]
MGLVVELNELEPNVYEIERTGKMRVPARAYGSESLVEGMQEPDDRALTQIQNAAALPGVEKFTLVLPDGHQGYGFPVGGVAAVDADDGVVCPAAIGYDINCGVRLLRTGLSYKDVVSEQSILADRLNQTIPTGPVAGGYVDADISDVRGILEDGLEWMHSNGHATRADLDHCEEHGRLPSDPNAVPTEALKRGVSQVGSLGAGTHFVEVQRVTDVYDDETAAAFGLGTDDVVVMIHSGSRGVGHQTCAHYIRAFEREYQSLSASLPDEQLVYAPLGDDLADEFRGAMNAAANFAWANRQAITEAVREVFDVLFGATGLEVVYDVCHNIAKEERHAVNGEMQTLLVHRKGATRAFPAGRPEVPEAYRAVGQPVFMPGSMGSHSYVLAGGPESLERSFGSAAHGAGRRKSRTEAASEYSAGELKKALRARGIFVRARSAEALTEEAPGAYKDIDEVVRVSDALGIGTKVARTVPLANVKG